MARAPLRVRPEAGPRAQRTAREELRLLRRARLGELRAVPECLAAVARDVPVDVLLLVPPACSRWAVAGGGGELSAPRGEQVRTACTGAGCSVGSSASVLTPSPTPRIGTARPHCRPPPPRPESTGT
eukprot:1081092-Prymnesium_polylepis.2